MIDTQADHLKPGDVFITPKRLSGEEVEWTTSGGGVRLIKTTKRAIDDLIQLAPNDHVTLEDR